MRRLKYVAGHRRPLPWVENAFTINLTELLFESLIETQLGWEELNSRWLMQREISRQKVRAPRCSIEMGIKGLLLNKPFAAWATLYCCHLVLHQCATTMSASSCVWIWRSRIIIIKERLWQQQKIAPRMGIVGYTAVASLHNCCLYLGTACLD